MAADAAFSRAKEFLGEIERVLALVDRLHTAAARACRAARRQRDHYIEEVRRQGATERAEARRRRNQRIVAMWEQGSAIGDIARIVGCTTHVVNNVLVRERRTEGRHVRRGRARW